MEMPLDLIGWDMFSYSKDVVNFYCLKQVRIFIVTFIATFIVTFIATFGVIFDVV